MKAFPTLCRGAMCSPKSRPTKIPRRSARTTCEDTLSGRLEGIVAAPLEQCGCVETPQYGAIETASIAYSQSQAANHWTKVLCILAQGPIVSLLPHRYIHTSQSAAAAVYQCGISWLVTREDAAST